MYVVHDNYNPLLVLVWKRYLYINIQNIDATDIDQITTIQSENFKIFEQKFGYVPIFMLSLALRKDVKLSFERELGQKNLMI